MLSEYGNMKHLNDLKPEGLVLKSAGELPYPFVIHINETGISNDTAYTFSIIGKDPLTGLNKTSEYHLTSREHQAYLDFFEKLATDFGLCVPRNRQPKPSLAAAEIPYREVLLRNLNSRMLYGYGDPALLRVETGNGPLYYLVSTSNDAPDSFPLLRSKNLEDWEFVKFIFPEGQKPEWAMEGEFVSDYWAPEIHQVGNEFRLYFVARHKSNSELCIGMARADSPEGTFVAEKEPVLAGNIIDPHIFVKDKDTTFMYWKEDNNDVWPGTLMELLHLHPEFTVMLFDEAEEQRTAAFLQTWWPWIKNLSPMERFLLLQVLIEAVISKYGTFCKKLQSFTTGQPEEIENQVKKLLLFMKTPMFAQRLSADGSALVGERTRIIENDLEWEAHLVEGMWLTEAEKQFYLFYAGNDFSTAQYGIGVAMGPSPLGPFTKMEKPLLQSTTNWWAPGHPSVVTAPDGRPYMFLHAFLPGEAGYNVFRALLSIPLQFHQNSVSLG